MPEGLVVLKSPHSVVETVVRVERAATARGLGIFARIDHAEGAAKAGMALRPTLLLMFGNPKGGTPLMQDRQTAGIDLPLKMLAWEDAEGTVWLGYNDPAWIAERHGLGPTSAAAVKAIATGLAAIAKEATGS